MSRLENPLLIIVSGYARSMGSLAEQIVDVFVGDLCERRLEVDAHLALPFDLSHDVLEDLGQFARCAAHAEPDEAEARALVEDHDEDDALRDDRDVDVVVLAFVRENRELFFANQPREAVGRGDVAGGQACQTRRVDLPDFSMAGYLLAILVDEENQLGVCVAAQTANDRFDLLVLLVIHHHGTVHGRCSLMVGRYWRIPTRMLWRSVSLSIAHG